MPVSTRQQLLDAALHLFAARGFYGASIAGIADETRPLQTGAALPLRHEREAVWRDPFADLGDDARASASGPSRSRDAGRSARSVLLRIRTRHSRRHRPLADPDARAAGQPGACREIAHLVPAPVSRRARRDREGAAGRQAARRARAFAFVYSILGAVHYFAVSEPTLSRMYGQHRYRAIRRQMGVELRALVRTRVGSLPG